jgi:predicted nucleotidyltransferase
MIELLESRRESIAEVCRRHRVARLDAFGSALRDDFDPTDSDLDLLVEFKPMNPYARVEAYFGLIDELRGLLGYEIDLVMVGAVRNPYIAQDIERTKELLYVRVTRGPTSRTSLPPAMQSAKRR